MWPERQSWKHPQTIYEVGNCGIVLGFFFLFFPSKQWVHSERQQNKEDSLKSASQAVKLAGISLLSWPNTPKEKGKILDFLWIFKGRNTPLSTSLKTAPFKAEASEIVHCISILLPAFIWEDVSIANKDGERKKKINKKERKKRKTRLGHYSHKSSQNQINYFGRATNVWAERRKKRGDEFKGKSKEGQTNKMWVSSGRAGLRPGWALWHPWYSPKLNKCPWHNWHCFSMDQLSHSPANPTSS